MRGVPDEQIGLMVDCRPVAGKIVAGLQEHRSQHHVMSDDPADTTAGNKLSAVSGTWSPGHRAFTGLLRAASYVARSQ
jgi:hypothetical protein